MLIAHRYGSGRPRFTPGTAGFDIDDEVHYPTRPVDRDKAEHELVINIKKATSPDETAPKQKHVRSASFNCSTGPAADHLQNASFLHGITTLRFRSGTGYAYSQSWLMKFKHSKR